MEDTTKASFRSEILISKHTLLIILTRPDWELNPGHVSHCCQVACNVTLPLTPSGQAL